MWLQAFASGIVVLLVLAGLFGSNFLLDRGVPNWLTRRIAPVLSGLAFLVAVVYLDNIIAIIVIGTFGLRDRSPFGLSPLVTRRKKQSYHPGMDGNYISVSHNT